jgi:hypothetical protein
MCGMTEAVDLRIGQAVLAIMTERALAVLTHVSIRQKGGRIRDWLSAPLPGRNRYRLNLFRLSLLV